MKQNRPGVANTSQQPGRSAVLKFLLSCVAIISGILTLVALLHVITYPNLPIRVLTVLPLPIFLLALLTLRSRSGKTEKIVAGSILLTFYVLGFVTTLRWGFDTPEGLLAITLAGIMTGLLYEGTVVWVIYVCAAVLFTVMASLQIIGSLPIRSGWKLEANTYADIIIYAATMAIIFAVTWLFNRQLQAAYLKSRASEEALREQSEHLEELVIQRTEALRQEHYQRVSDLHRFVLYGKEASGLLHDILNPLTALGLQLSTLKKKTNSTQLVQAEATLQRLEQLVTGARRHMRRETEPEAFSLHSEAGMVFQSVQHRARKHHVKLELKGEDVQVFADPILVYKILQNLVVNSLDACLLVPEEGRSITVDTKKVNKKVTIHVHDSGIGMTKKQAEQAFTPYFTTKERHEGAGIGLSLTRELVEEMGGSITLSSKPRQGTVVTVTLPLHAA